jgi:hypothetical protein
MNVHEDKTLNGDFHGSDVATFWWEAALEYALPPDNSSQNIIAKTASLQLPLLKQEQEYAIVVITSAVTKSGFLKRLSRRSISPKTEKCRHVPLFSK